MATTSSLDANRDVVRRISSAVSDNTLDELDDLVAPDYVEHNPLVSHELRGPAAIRASVEPFLAAFSDFALIEDDTVAEADRVAYRHHVEGTHTAPLLGVAPTNECIRVDGIAIYQLEDDRATEKWLTADTMGLMQQLGASPAGGPR